MTGHWVATRLLLLAICAASALCGANAQSTTSRQFDPFPGGIASRYRFDLGRNLFTTPDAEQEERERLTTALGTFRIAANSGPLTSNRLLSLLRTADSLENRLGRHYAYLSLRPSIDSRDSDANVSYSAIGGAAQRAFAPFTELLAGVTDSQLNQFTKEVPALSTYRFAIVRSRDRTAAALPDSVRRSIPTLQTTAFTWGPQRFRQILGTIDFGKVKAPEGELDVRTQNSLIYNHANRQVREAGFRANNAGIASRKDSFAELVTTTARARNTLARYRGFRDHREESYAERYLATEDVQRLLNAVVNASAVNKRSERLRIERIRRTFGFDTVHFWDLPVPPVGSSAPRLTITEATETIVAATSRLGSQYSREMRALLDPANGRIDLFPAPNRAERPGFSTGSVGYPSLMFQGRYDGFVNDVVILVHEAGHGVQNMLMDDRGVLPRYASGPGYFTESYAALNELLLLDHLSKTARDTTTRIYYLERLLDQTADLFRNAVEALAEDRIYASEAAGTRLDADGIERLFQQTGSQFSIWYGPGSETELAWTRPLQFFTRPLYRLNYVLAKLLALNYLQRLESDPSFAARYHSLLSRGYDASPDVLLRAEVDIDLKDPDRLVRNATARFSQWTDDLERLYRATR